MCILELSIFLVIFEVTVAWNNECCLLANKTVGAAEMFCPIEDFQIKHLKLGVEVSGVDLESKVTSDMEFFKCLKEDIRKHRLVVFRNQSQLSPSSYVAIAKVLGKVFDDPYVAWMDEYRNHSKSPLPTITRLSNDKSEGYTAGGKKGWHIDGAFSERPHAFIMFHAVHASRTGDTRFAAFRNVVQALRLEKLERLYINHTRIIHGKLVTVIHPLVYNHPHTREKVLCIHLGFMESMFELLDDNITRSLTQIEVDSVKNEITEAIVVNNDEFVYSHKWEQGDVVIADNLALTHEATRESKLPVEEIGLRVLHWIKILSETKPMKYLN